MYERLKEHLARPVPSARDIAVRDRPRTYTARNNAPINSLECLGQPFFDDEGYAVLRGLLTFKQAHAVGATTASGAGLRPAQDAWLRAAWRRLNTALDKPIGDVTINIIDSAADMVFDDETLGSTAMTGIVILTDNQRLAIDRPGLVCRKKALLEPGDALLIRSDAPQQPEFNLYNQSAETLAHVALLQSPIITEM